METDGFQRAPLAQFGLDNSSCWQFGIYGIACGSGTYVNRRKLRQKVVTGTVTCRTVGVCHEGPTRHQASESRGLERPRAAPR
jgi:hypothetical protein